MTEKDIKTVFGQAYQGSALFDNKILSHILGSCNITGTTINYAIGNEDATRANIDNIQDYGEYTTVNGDPIRFFDVTLNDSCNITHARVNIQLVLRKLWKDNYSGMVLVFHYASTSQRADKDTWRFSWVERKTSGTTTTPGKRYTYLCGPAYSCRTIAERFDVLQKTANKTLDSITAAFDVEALSDEFFYNFRAIYSKIKCEGEKWKSKKYTTPYAKLSDIKNDKDLGFCDFIERYKNDTRYFGEEFTRWESKLLRDYIKKMMGRLVFLQFLQKKGWMCGNPNYLKSLFEKFVQGKRESVTDTAPGSFLDEVLEPLFFGVLNTKAKDREELFKNEKWNLDLLNEWKDIPYLNGGLFEQEVYDKPKSAFPNVLFNELFTLFSEYNFTIDENDPDDKEVGIDPEMLSKIFESQLEDNKDKGAFYTPKEIVEYMCKESLIAYLQTDITDEGQKENIRSFVCDREASLQDEVLKRSIAEKLKNVKICDPAIGSGAFPMGMLNLLVTTREKIEGEQNRLELKKEIICNNLYGVDIEKGAVDIARLRFWLSLVIDEEEPSALPNLDYKIMQGNSLLEQYEGVDLSGMSLNEQAKSKVKKGQSWQQTLVFDEQGALDNIQNAIRESFATEDHNKKSELREIINENIKNYIYNLKGCTPEIQQKLTVLPIPNDQFFLWHIYFKEVFNKGGFDIVIGNPPYIQLQANGGALANLYEPCKFKTFDRMGDIYSLFYEYGNSLLKRNGALCYITSNKWMRTGYGEKTRKFFKDDVCPLLLVDFIRMKLFDDATVETNILLFTKANYDVQTKCSAVVELKKNELDKLTSIINDNTYTNVFDNSDFWVLSSPIVGKLKAKLKSSGQTLKEWDLNIFRGVLTGFNDAFVITGDKRNEILNACTSEQELERTKDLIAPVIRGRYVQTYQNPKTDLWLISTFPSKQYDIEMYPAVKNFILSFGMERVEQTGIKRIINGQEVKARKKTKHKWFETQDPIAYWEDLAKPKIVWKRIGSILRFAYDEGKSMCLDSTCFATGEYVKFLCALFNSKLGHFILQDSPKTGTGDLLVSVQAIEPIHVPMPDDELRLKIENIVDRILTAKKSNPQADTSEWEKEIDKLVYELYGLTEEEIRIVEGKE